MGNDRRWPANASEIWITHIYEIAFGQVRFGIASAYSVILFIVMMSMGYFYVRALTGGDEKRAADGNDGKHATAGEEAQKKKKADFWSIAGWVFLFLLLVFCMLPMFLDGDHLAQGAIRGAAISAAVVSARSTLEQYKRLLSWNNSGRVPCATWRTASLGFR